MADIVKDLTTYRIKGIEKAEIEYYQALTRTLDRIEDPIISLADKQLLEYYQIKFIKIH